MRDWDDYRLILALYRARTVRGAADRLGINHSTVSRRLSQIQKQFGAPVFERVTGGYQVTVLGEHLVDVAEQMEHLAFATHRQQKAIEPTISGMVTLSIPEAIGQFLLLDELMEIGDLFPEINLVIHSSYRFANLDKSEADIVIRGTDQPPDHLVGRRLFPYALSYYCRSDYLKKTPMEARVWLTAMSSRNNPDWLKASPFPKAKIKLQTDDITLLYRAVMAGGGMSRLPCYIGDAEPSLIRIPHANTTFLQDIWVLTHPDLKDTPRIKTIMRYLAEAITAKRDLVAGNVARN